MCLKFCKKFTLYAKNGEKVILRRPRISDVKQLLDYINSLIEEDAPIEAIKKKTLKEERAWLKDNLKKIRGNKLHHLVAEYDGKIIGSVELRKDKERRSHIAEYGISVSKDYRNLGIGTKMSKIILDIAKKDKDIKIVYLRVYEINKNAIYVYKKLGFKKVAVIPKRIRYKRKYVDEIEMDFPIRRS